jgi:hypothetical protein
MTNSSDVQEITDGFMSHQRASFNSHEERMTIFVGSPMYFSGRTGSNLNGFGYPAMVLNN